MTAAGALFLLIVAGVFVVLVWGILQAGSFVPR